MEYNALKGKLLGMFAPDKLGAYEGEWGFYNESERDVRCICYSVNLTPEVIEQANENQGELLLTHHDSWEFVDGLKTKCNGLLSKYNITHGFFHAPLDDADFGTSASLAKAMEMTDCQKAVPYMDIFYAGIIGQVSPVDFNIFKDKLVSVLGEEVRSYQNNRKKVAKICVVTGGGNMTSDIKAAVDEGCDTYITGEYSLYSQMYARLAGINLLVGSHTNTEMFGVETMVSLLIEGTDITMVKMEEPNE